MSVEPQVAALAAEPARGRPALRGVLHLGAAIAATAGAAGLLLLAHTPTGYVGAAVFGSSLILLYWTSAAYHRVPWPGAVQGIVKRLDHAMIFVLIAGTYTAFAFKVSPAWWIPMLSVVWGLAGAGALLKVLWPDAPRWFSVTLYVGLGWVALVAASEILTEFPVGPIAMLVAGGALYTLGGVIYAARRPDPWPAVFGYHEVFHALVIAGSAVHFAAVAIYVLPN